MTHERPLTDWKATVDRPIFVDNGKSLLWLEADPYKRPALVRYDFQTGKTQRELEIDGAGGLSVAPGGRWVVMARLNYFQSSQEQPALRIRRVRPASIVCRMPNVWHQRRGWRVCCVPGSGDRSR